MKIIHKNLVRITLSSLIYTVSGGLVGVFLPLILLGNGLQLWQMCGFYVIYGVFKILINYNVVQYLDYQLDMPLVLHILYFYLAILQAITFYY